MKRALWVFLVLVAVSACGQPAAHAGTIIWANDDIGAAKAVTEAYAAFGDGTDYYTSDDDSREDFGEVGALSESGYGHSSDAWARTAARKVEVSARAQAAGSAFPGDCDGMAIALAAGSFWVEDAATTLTYLPVAFHYNLAGDGALGSSMFQFGFYIQDENGNDIFSVGGDSSSPEGEDFVGEIELDLTSGVQYSYFMGALVLAGAWSDPAKSAVPGVPVDQAIGDATFAIGEAARPVPEPATAALLLPALALIGFGARRARKRNS